VAKPIIHARSCARRFGGSEAEHLPVHQLMDRSKGAAAGSNLHRALTHHGEFLWMLEAIFGVTFGAGGRDVSTRDCGERHLMEDHHGAIPIPGDYWRVLAVQPWMTAGAATETIAAHTQRSVAALGGDPAAHRRVHVLLEYGRPSLPVGVHRGLTHHSFGVWLVEQAMGETLPGDVATREVCRVHIEHDLGRTVPDPGEWLEHLTFAAWMSGGRYRPPSAKPLEQHRAARRPARPARPASPTAD
jgi:hypothetical protein